MRRSKKFDPEFQDFLAKNASLDRETGEITFRNLYVSMYLNIGWKGSVVSVPTSHVVWFLHHGRWPLEGMFIDHINDKSLDNRPVNLQELTEAENQKKRRGRMVYRSYGSGKYGHGITLHFDKRDSRYYITRYLSRGHGAGDLKTIRRGFGGFSTQAEAEAAIKSLVAEIEKHGPLYGMT